MNEALLFLHLVGLMLGAAGGFASAVIMRRALVLPADEAKVVKGLGPILANVSGIGLALLWASGLILVWTKFDGFGSLPQMFWVKAIFIASLTIVTGLIHMTYAEIRKGNVALAARLPRLGPMAGISALLAVLFAVVAFN
ncbi:MAG: hypothetical protein Q8L53_18835 [Aestuariivirga sp.]|nr:hypothetical protein [Aestuariivirga sp.]